MEIRPFDCTVVGTTTKVQCNALALRGFQVRIKIGFSPDLPGKNNGSNLLTANVMKLALGKGNVFHRGKAHGARRLDP